MGFESTSGNESSWWKKVKEFFTDNPYEPIPTTEEEADKEREVPPLLRPYSRQNIAIILSYFCVGIALNFIGTPIIYYAIETLDASAAQQTVISTAMMLPWALKVFLGLLSDSHALWGSHRKSYFTLGWIIFVLSNIALAILGEPSLVMVVLLIFTQTCGFLLSDVCTDAMIVERSKFEDLSHRGSYQSLAYTIRFAGSILGSVLGSILYNQSSWGWGLSIAQICLLNALFPIMILGPFIPRLYEVHHEREYSVGESISLVYRTCCLKAVYQPMFFIYFYNMMMIPNSAWMNFLVEGLGFSDFDLGILSIFGSVAAWLGLVVYRRYYFQSSWRGIYIVTTFIMAFFSILQLALIFRWNKKVGISDLAFSVGDDTINEMIMAIQFLPACIMYIGICKDGVEGTTFAALTSFSNLAYTVGSDIGMVMTNIWDVSNGTLADHDYSGLWKLTLLVSCLAVIPIVFVGYLPNNKEDQIRLQDDKTSSTLYGKLLVFLLFFSILWTIAESIYEIYA